MSGYLLNEEGDYVFEGWNPNSNEGPFTEGQICTMVGGYQTVMELAEKYFWQRYRADPEWQGHFIHEPGITVTIDYGEVSVEAEARACTRGCCGTDSHTFSFPLSYLWLDQTAILADLKAKADREAAAKAEKERQAEASRKAHLEAQERKEFIRLQQKFQSGL